MSTSFVASKESQCDNKCTFPNSHVAKVHAKQAQTKYGGSKLTVYKCPHCGWYHAGHAKKSGRDYG